MYFAQNEDSKDELEFLSESSVSDKHYEWQVSFGQEWLPIDNDHVIETHYCQPGAKGITIRTSHGPVFIDFDQLKVTNAPLRVQRVTFLPQGQTEDVGWYFRDDQLWREYGTQSSSLSTSLISSRDVEYQFTQNPQGSFTFMVGSTVYTLDFATMSQTNGTTGLRRNVRRRPKFTSSTKSLYSTSVFPTASSSQPTNGSYRWEFMEDEGVWTEYQAHMCSYDSIAIERQYQLNPQGQLHFRVKRYSYTLDFSRMHQVNNNIGTIRAVRRTADHSSQQNGSANAQPRWQFLDMDGLWKDYAKGKRQCSMSGQDIELHYQQNPTGTIKFNTTHFSYELNFSTMTQRNLSTNTSRSVRRL